MSVNLLNKQTGGIRSRTKKINNCKITYSYHLS